MRWRYTTPSLNKKNKNNKMLVRQLDNTTKMSGKCVEERVYIHRFKLIKNDSVKKSRCKRNEVAQ